MLDEGGVCALRCIIRALIRASDSEPKLDTPNKETVRV